MVEEEAPKGRKNGYDTDSCGTCRLRHTPSGRSVPGFPIPPLRGCIFAFLFKCFREASLHDGLQRYLSHHVVRVALTWANQRQAK